MNELNALDAAEVLTKWDFSTLHEGLLTTEPLSCDLWAEELSPIAGSLIKSLIRSGVTSGVINYGDHCVGDQFALVLQVNDWSLVVVQSRKEYEKAKMDDLCSF